MMSSEGEAKLRRIIDTAEDLRPIPLTGGMQFARIPAGAAGKKLSANDWQVYVAIASHADKSGKAHPSLYRIARLTGMHRSHVSRSINRLKAAGLLKSWRVPRGDGWANNNYQIIYIAVEATPEPADEVASPDSGMPDETIVPETGLSHPVAPETVQGGTSYGGTTSTWDGTLTDHLTGMTKEEVIEDINDKIRDDTSDGSTHTTSPDLPSVVAAPMDPHNTCSSYVTNQWVHRLCGKPALLGDTHCAEHQPGRHAPSDTEACYGSNSSRPAAPLNSNSTSL
jgi:hypothetical protein